LVSQKNLDVLRIVDLLCRCQHVVAAAHVAEAVCQVGADASARGLLSFHTARVEARDDLVDAHHMRNGWAAMHVSGPHAALEEPWCETVLYALKNVRLLENLAERCVVSIRLGPLCCRVGAEDDCVAVVTVRRCDGGLKSWKEGLLCVSQDVASHGPAAPVEVLLVENAAALLHQAAEGIDLVSEHLCFCKSCGG